MPAAFSPATTVPVDRATAKAWSKVVKIVAV
jgi:hypothetical protein